MSEAVVFSVAFGLYILADGLLFAALFTGKEKPARLGLYAGSVGFAVHLFAMVLRTAGGAHAPFTNMYESLSFLAWAVVLAWLVLQKKAAQPRLGPYLMLIVIGLMALASSPLMPKEVAPLVPALQSYWLWLHVSVTLLGEAFFAAAFVSSLLYLAAGSEEKRLKLDELGYRAVAVGFPLFTLGALVFGMVWAYRAWGRYWSWDPKEVWSLVTWFVYALYLHTRAVMGWKGKRSAVIAVIGFLAAMFTYFGVNYFISSLHSYK